MPTKKIVEVYSFHPLDQHGKINPHFLYTKASVGKRFLLFFYKTSISQYLQRIPLANFAKRISKRDCLDDYIAKQERIMEYYRREVASIENELAILKYIDPEKIPCAEVDH